MSVIKLYGLKSPWDLPGWRDEFRCRKEKVVQVSGNDPTYKTICPKSMDRPGLRFRLVPSFRDNKLTLTKFFTVDYVDPVRTLTTTTSKFPQYPLNYTINIFVSKNWKKKDTSKDSYCTFWYLNALYICLWGLKCSLKNPEVHRGF